MTVPLVIYHAQCVDGWSSAFWLGRFLDGRHHLNWLHQGHEKHPGRYDEPAPDCRGRDVYMVDFCYKADQLALIRDSCRTLTILDHHRSQEPEVAACGGIPIFAKLPPVDYPHDRLAVFDYERSGIGLAAQWVMQHDGPLPPAWFANIEDRDLWRFALDNTAEVFAAITSYPYDAETWERLLTVDYGELITEGAAIQRYRGQVIESVVGSAYQGYVLSHEGIWMASCPVAVCSEVGEVLARRDPQRFSATYTDLAVNGRKRKWSLRSTPFGMDVSTVAAMMSPTGGGHPHAAGAMVELYDSASTLAVGSSGFDVT